MSVHEFARWRQFHRTSPIDDESVHQAGLALLTSIYVNAHQPKGRAAKKPSDFLVMRGERTDVTPAIDVDTKLRALFQRVKPNPA